MGVPLEAGDAEGSLVNRLSSLVMVRDNLARELATVDGPAITIGGDCGVEVGAIGHVLDQDVAVVWIDAHPDLSTPQTSGSHAFHAMVLRTLLGDGPPALVPATALPVSRLVLVGTRAVDADEQEFIEASGVAVVTPEAFSPEALIAAVEATGAASVYVHIDLDVLDPGRHRIRDRGRPSSPVVVRRRDHHDAEALDGLLFGGIEAAGAGEDEPAGRQHHLGHERSRPVAEQRAQHHAVEGAGRARLGRVEVGVRVEPDHGGVAVGDRARGRREAHAAVAADGDRDAVDRRERLGVPGGDHLDRAEPLDGGAEGVAGLGGDVDRRHERCASSMAQRS